jgi:choline transporter-like protein 2/4/5
MSLRHWQQMGGVKINEDIIIDKSIHRSINSRSSVLKVKDLLSEYFFIIIMVVDGKYRLTVDIAF